MRNYGNDYTPVHVRKANNVQSSINSLHHTPLTSMKRANIQVNKMSYAASSAS